MAPKRDRRGWVLLAVSLLSAACAAGTGRQGPTRAARIEGGPAPGAIRLDGGPRDPVVTPDGTVYVVLQRAGQLLRISPTGRDRELLAAGLRDPHGLVRDRDGALCVAQYETGELTMVQRGRGRRLAAGLQGPVALAGEPDGTLLVLEFEGGRLTAVKPDGRRVVRVSGLARPHSLALVPGGTLVIAEFGPADRPGPVGRVIEVSRHGDLVERVTGLDAPIAVVAGRRGEIVVAESGRGIVWQITPDGRRTPLLVGHPGVRGLAFMPRGDLLVADRDQGLLLTIPVNRLEAARALARARRENGSSPLPALTAGAPGHSIWPHSWSRRG
ncbi:MAG: hypothetical protein HYV08_10775 [Deltaproteobacteria bacterium]|nr:hypothetical protein [Deltaproteobacteria bacterium]MBI3079605.1 hypothetical protein [Deltaproteobacteria bacterium]